MINLLLVGLGGLIGAMARYGVSLGISCVSCVGAGVAFPWATFVVNISGCFLFGIGLATFGPVIGAESRVPLFVLTGILGGFTTFSAFGSETLTLIGEKEWGMAIAYLGGSCIFGVLALLIGLKVAGGTLS